MKILIAVGGTAGHINPALAVATYIRENYDNSQILFVGTKDHLEARLVPNAGFELKTIEISGFLRSFKPQAIIHNIRTIFLTLKSSIESRKIIKEFKPDVCVGFGGYVSGPVLRCAARMKIPTCIHEQNAFPGITNKALARQVDRVMLAVGDAAKRLDAKNECVVTGMPVRGELLRANRDDARKELGIEGDKPLVLSFSGSLGAKPINDAMIPVLLSSAKNQKYYHIHSFGSNCGDEMKLFEKEGFEGGKCSTVEVREYIDNMDVCMAAADLVIGRAGASTLSEIEALGKASILIPSPYVAENHQYYNALALKERNGAEIIEEKDLTSEVLQSEIDAILSDKEKLHSMEQCAKSASIENATERIAEVITELGRK